MAMYNDSAQKSYWITNGTKIKKRERERERYD